MWTRNRVQAAPVVVSRRHLESAEPQAVVVNAGVANAATGRPGEEDADATAAARARCSGSRRGDRRPLDRRHRAPAADGEDLERRRRRRRHPLPRRRPAASEAILTTDAGPKTAVAHGDGFVVGGMAKGAGMIHPALATMLAVVTTDYPLEPGEADALPPAGRRGDLQPHLGRRRLLDERRGRPARERAVGRHARRGPRRAVRRRAPRRSAPTSRDRSSPTAKARPSSSRSASRARLDRGGAGDRAPGRDVAARQDRRLRARPELGARPRRRRARLRRTAASRTSTPTGSRSRSTAPPSSSAARRPGSSPSSAAPACTIDLDLGLGDGEAAYLASDLSYDYVRLNAEYTT